jgi:GTP-binding protein HflX
LTIDEDDLMTEKHQDTIQEWKSTWMGRVGRKMLCSFRQQTKNFEELRERLYEVVREIHTRFPYNKYPDYKDAVEKEDEDEQEEK